jgi:hypothetical protein
VKTDSENESAHSPAFFVTVNSDSGFWMPWLALGACFGSISCIEVLTLAENGAMHRRRRKTHTTVGQRMHALRTAVDGCCSLMAEAVELSAAPIVTNQFDANADVAPHLAGLYGPR